eukprot:2406419-Pyramimonas_sp.AAC.2
MARSSAAAWSSRCSGRPRLARGRRDEREEGWGRERERIKMAGEDKGNKDEEEEHEEKDDEDHEEEEETAER